MTNLKSGKNQTRWTRIVLQISEMFFMLIGFVALGFYGFVQSDAYLFQVYQNWRLDQLQQGKPASIELYVEQWLPSPWNENEDPPDESLKKSQDNPESSGGNLGTVEWPSSNAGSNVKPDASLKLSEGLLVGRIGIPRLDLTAIILEGVQPQTLRVAVGHLPGTPLPGESGNVELAAHRDTFFRGLRKVQKGDLITLSTISGASYEYRVESLAVVSPNTTDILTSFPGPGLNLITCYPFYYVGPAPKRYVVHAVEVNDSASADDHARFDPSANKRADPSSAIKAVKFERSSDHPSTRSPRAGSHRTSPRPSQDVMQRTSTPSSRTLTPKADETSTRLMNAHGSSNVDPPRGTTAHPSNFYRLGMLFRKIIGVTTGAKKATPLKSQVGS